MDVKWWVKIPAKIVLSRLPIKYSTFRRFSMFKHGDMIDPHYAFGIAKQHYDKAKSSLKSGFTALELGPGDSLMSALNITALGAEKCYLVDAGEFATKDLASYKTGLAYLAEHSMPLTKVNNDPATLEELLNDLDTTYLTSGLASLATIPDQSVDMIWSHSVLQHIRLAEFDAMMEELYRVLKPNGIFSNVVDLTDTIDDTLNNLRFNDKLWEANFIANSGFYTNRLRYNEMIQRFKQAGFTVSSEETRSWQNLPINQARFNQKYKDYPEQDLLIYGCDVVLKKELQ